MFALLISNGTAGLAKGLDYHTTPLILLTTPLILLTTPLTPLTNYKYHLTHSLPILYTEAKLSNCLFFLDYSEDGSNWLKSILSLRIFRSSDSVNCTRLALYEAGWSSSDIHVLCLLTSLVIYLFPLQVKIPVLFQRLLTFSTATHFEIKDFYHTIQHTYRMLLIVLDYSQVNCFK